MNENAFTVLLLLAAPMSALPFSLITYRMNDIVFTNWRNFALWWVPLMCLVSYFLFAVKESTGGLGISGTYDKSFTLLILATIYAIFVLVSTIIILWKWYSLRGK